MKTLTGIGLIITFWVLFLTCGTKKTRFADKGVQRGYELAQKKCSGCHLLPEPGLLDKSTWANHVLPKMGELLGFRYLGFNSYVEANDTTTMKLDEWKDLIKYYEFQAPVSLKQNRRLSNIGKSEQFEVMAIESKINHPATTLVKIAGAGQGFYFGDGQNGRLYYVANGRAIRDSNHFSKGICHLIINDTALEVLTMGVLHPSDSKNGMFISMDKKSGKYAILLDSLQRPVHAACEDLNADGLIDILVCEFGNNSGQLSWFENQGERRYRKHILRALPGAIKTEVRDFNRDGLPDIIALMAQGDEGIFIYYNLGNSSFREQRLITFPPSYGVNYFEMADFNKDGHLDILTTNGDNGDYPPVLKPYHGLRIFLFAGDDNYRETLFLPMNGVGKAVALDFDKDGDLDIASAAFFPDLKNSPDEGFIYWENNGDLKYSPYTVSQPIRGRWLTLDVGDIDGDGDPDIILGNTTFSIGLDNPGEGKRTADSISVVILKNKTR